MVMNLFGIHEPRSKVKPLRTPYNPLHVSYLPPPWPPRSGIIRPQPNQVCSPRVPRTLRSSMTLHVPRVPHLPPLPSKFLLILQRQLKDQPFWNSSLDYSLVSSTGDFISITTASQKTHYQRKGIFVRAWTTTMC